MEYVIIGLMLKVHNTLTRTKETFIPLIKDKVSFYYCGPTVYWTQHIGNLRGSLCADTVVRSLRYLGYEVTYIRNYTDVGHLTSDEDTGEDKMEKGSRREGVSPQEIAQKYIAGYERDTQALCLVEPTVKCRATFHIREMITMVQTLLDKGYAYATDLAIYFDVSKAKNYTALSGQNMEELVVGAGNGEISDPGKRNAVDFVIWFFKAGAHKNALQYWESPFVSSLVQNGEGFPGWHIECSAMSKKYLGDTMDLHMGGIEHIPIHHTNEIAQSESANGKQFVRYWLHNEHLLVNDRKMAKSEGTGFTVDDLKEKGYEPLSLRFFFLQAHYRSKQNFTWEALTASVNGLERFRQKFCALGGSNGSVDALWNQKFVAAVEDDFNMPEALAVAYDVLRSDLSHGDKRATLLSFDTVLGLQLDTACTAESEVTAEVRELLKERECFRSHKQFIQADAVRKKIEALGYEIQDMEEGVTVKKSDI
ncbi:MAG: cysteine--tRNA ligase [bacterium]